MTHTNAQLEKMQADLSPLLGRRGLLGYAAAKNTRAIRDEIAEYIEAKNAAIQELGEPVIDDTGNPTGQVELRFDSPAFAEFQRRMAPLAEVRCEPRLLVIDAKDVMADMTGEEMLAVEWMLRFDDEDA